MEGGVIANVFLLGRDSRSPILNSYCMALRKTILIVEDEMTLSDALIEMLLLENFSCLQSRDGENALKIAFSKRPDLILLDFLMPGIGGASFLKSVREDDWGATVPIIVLTNLDGTDAQLTEAMRLYKPVRFLIKAEWKLCNIIKAIEAVLGA